MTDRRWRRGFGWRLIPSHRCVSEPESPEPGAEGGSTGGGEQGEELGQRASMWH